MSDFDRLVAAMKEARARMTGRTMDEVEEDIHRETLASLESPEPEESLDEYVARMVDERGTGVADAAAERHQGANGREARAEAAARTAIADAMRKPGGAQR